MHLWAHLTLGHHTKIKPFITSNCASLRNQWLWTEHRECQWCRGTFGAKWYLLREKSVELRINLVELLAHSQLKIIVRILLSSQDWTDLRKKSQRKSKIRVQIVDKKPSKRKRVNDCTMLSYCNRCKTKPIIAWLELST